MTNSSPLSNKFLHNYIIYFLYNILCLIFIYYAFYTSLMLFPYTDVKMQMSHSYLIFSKIHCLLSRFVSVKTNVQIGVSLSKTEFKSLFHGFCALTEIPFEMCLMYVYGVWSVCWSDSSTRCHKSHICLKAHLW